MTAPEALPEHAVFVRKRAFSISKRRTGAQLLFDYYNILVIKSIVFRETFTYRNGRFLKKLRAPGGVQRLPEHAPVLRGSVSKTSPGAHPFW